MWPAGRTYVARGPDVCGPRAGRMWPAGRTYVARGPDVCGPRAGRMWPAGRTYVARGPDIKQTDMEMTLEQQRETASQSIRPAWQMDHHEGHSQSVHRDPSSSSSSSSSPPLQLIRTC
ncbi:hypothetical protein PAMA_016089 [Pampus argenteus]